LPDDDAFSHLPASFHSQDWYLASQNLTKIYQKCIRRRVRAVLTQQIFLSPIAFLAGYTGGISKRKDAGMGKICTSKPTWFDSRSATHFASVLKTFIIIPLFIIIVNRFAQTRINSHG